MRNRRVPNRLSVSHVFPHKMMQPPAPGSFRPVGSGIGKGPSTPVSPVVATPTMGRSLRKKRSKDHGLSMT